MQTDFFFTWKKFQQQKELKLRCETNLSLEQNINISINRPIIFGLLAAAGQHVLCLIWQFWNPPWFCESGGG